MNQKTSTGLSDAAVKSSDSGLLCWAEPFGFGPSAAVNLFAPHLPDPKDFAGTSFTCDLQSTSTFRRIIDCDPPLSPQGAARFKKLCSNYRAVFIACDFKTAELSIEAGCKTVLYDPIPWFWRGKLPEVCHQVEAYICQDFFEVGERLKKEQVINAKIVPPLFPHTEKPEKTSGVLVNLGGLQNPFMSLGECRRYAQLILDNVANFVDGQYSGFSSGAVVEGVLGHPFFTGQPEQLRKRLAKSRLAFMTPGLGNIYDAAALGDFVCFLPPTNDSQGQQLFKLREHGLAPLSMDWHELLEGTGPIDYAGMNQEEIIKAISCCFHQLLEDPRAQRRLEEFIQSAIEKSKSPDCRRPLRKLVDMFGGSKDAAQEVGAVVHRVLSHPPLKKAPTESAFSSAPIINKDIENPYFALKQLHEELNGTGFHTLSYLMEFLSLVYKRYGEAPTEKEWQQAIDEFSPDPKELLAKYGASYCTPLAEILIERAKNELGIEGRIVYVDYQDSKRPLSRVWPGYQGPVHVDAVFQYRQKGSLKNEVIHIICGLGNGASRFKYFEEIDDHRRFLVDRNYKVNAYALDRSSFYRDVLRRFNFVQIVKGPEVNRNSQTFSVDMISGTMKFKDKTFSLDSLLEGRDKDFLEHVQKEFLQPETFIDTMLVLARLRRGFCRHVLMPSCSHLENALRNLTGWIEEFGLKPLSEDLVLALENFLGSPSPRKVARFISYFSKASKIWLGMQTKAPAERDVETLLLQCAALFDHHVVIHREAILGKNANVNLEECLELLPKREELIYLAKASKVFPTDEERDKFVDDTLQILFDHLLLAFVEAGIAERFRDEEMKTFKENFASLINAEPGLSEKSGELLLTLLSKMLQRERAPQSKMQVFSAQEAAPAQIDGIESYYWENIPVRELLRNLPQSTRAFSVAAQVETFEDAPLLKAVLRRHRPPASPDKESAALIFSGLFNNEIMTLFQRYAGVGLGPQMTKLFLDAARRFGMTGRFQSEALVGFQASRTNKLEELCIHLELANRIAHQSALKLNLAKHWRLPLFIDPEALLNRLPAEFIVNFFRSRFLGQFIAGAEDGDLVEILADLIASDPEMKSPHQRPTLLRTVDRAFMKTTLKAPLFRLRQSIQQLLTHPLGPQAMETIDEIETLDSHDLIARLQKDIENRVQIADRLWDEELRQETGGCLTQEMKCRFATMRHFWVEHELPYYEPNCAVSVIFASCEMNERERDFLSFYEKVRVFWQDPFAIGRALQRLSGLIETLGSGMSRVFALQKLLENAEKEMGFNEVVNLSKGFSQEEFYKVLKGGHPFNDLIFQSQPHGSRVHRLQWLLLYLEFGREEPRFLGDAYRQLGDATFMKNLGYPLSQTKEDIWRLLFDNLHQSNFSCADHVMRVFREQLGFDPDQVSQEECLQVIQNRKKNYDTKHHK